jgi:hypothetical protein
LNNNNNNNCNAVLGIMYWGKGQDYHWFNTSWSLLSCHMLIQLFPPTNQ